MTMQFRTLAEQAMADGAITHEEILALRRESWGDGIITLDEADAIFVLNEHLAEGSQEWSDFFIEALGEFIVNGHEPRGYVDQAQGDWLIGHVDRDGKVASLTELELLVRIVERALNMPERLKDYALKQVERAILSGEGPTRAGGVIAPGSITAGECRLLRRMIFAAGGDRPAGVSRAEAEMLFRLKDASLGKDNAPEWKQLFVQGVGNYLSGLTSYTQLSEERATELESFMAAPSAGLGAFFRHMARTDVGDAVGRTFGRKGLPRDLAAEEAAASAVTSGEKLWLQTQMDADNVIDEFEEALLAFLAEETVPLRP